MVLTEQQRFKEAFQNSPAGLAITDKHGVFLSVNQAFLDIFGYEEPEVVGKSSVELNMLPADVRHASAQRIKKYGKVSGAEIEMQTKNGEKVYILFSSNYVDLNGGSSYFTTLIDISAEYKLYEETIFNFTRMLELRDVETAEHARRVTELAVRLARELEMNDIDPVHLRRGAQLHDIGKIGIRDEILLKSTRLTPQEFDIMKTHTVLGYDALKGMDFLSESILIPYCHHEKWDGSGYPRGLKGDEIPLAARIFSVVDVYDALTSDRPYRKAWEPERALNHIRLERGVAFDPKIVDAFIEMLEQKA